MAIEADDEYLMGFTVRLRPVFHEKVVYKFLDYMLIHAGLPEQ